MSILLVNGNALQIPLADKSVQCVVTSPPYFALRDYGIEGQLGLEQTPGEYIENMVLVFREVWRVLRDDGTLWINIGDSYAGGNGNGGVGPASSKQVTNKGSYFGPIARSKCLGRGPGDRWGGGDRKVQGLPAKNLLGIPWRLAFALQDDGWILRSDIVWSKPNPMPESVTDRPTKSHEYIFLLTKSQQYFYDAEAITEPVSENTHMRVSQNIADQVERFRANGGGKTNGPMKAVLRGCTRKLAAEGSGIKSNCSMNLALALPVDTRNKRTVWTIPTQGYSGVHFATFPFALAEPCIKAGTSQVGCCPTCGAPWERVVEVEGGTIGKSWVDHSDDKGKGMAQRHEGGKPIIQAMRDSYKNKPYQKTDLGFQSTCSHDKPAVPCVVIDPFVGSGTTLMVARKLGRDGVGLDLSWKYLVECARERLGLNALEEWENGLSVDNSDLSELPLFREGSDMDITLESRE